MTNDSVRHHERVTETASPAISRAFCEAYAPGTGRELYNSKNVELNDGFTISDDADENTSSVDKARGQRPDRVGGDAAGRIRETMGKYWDQINTDGGQTIQKGELKRFLDSPASASLTAEERANLSTALANFQRIENGDRSGGPFEGLDLRGISKKDLAAFPVNERRFDQAYGDVDYMKNNFDAIKGDDDVVSRDEIKAYRERRAAEGADQSELDALDRWSRDKAQFKRQYIDRKESFLNLVYTTQGYRSPYRL